MKFSENWLREWVNPQLTTAELAEQLTMAGLEVDAIESLAPKFSGVVIGEIVAAEPHPEADRLQVCRVNSGSDELQIVCGAANARPGIRVPLAVIGAELPDNFKIKKAKLRNVESFGMLCAGTELGLDIEGDGLWELPADAPVGEDLAVWLKLDDNTIEVDLTPNRADCLGVQGLAREVGVLNKLDVQYPVIQPVKAQTEQSFNIKLSYPEGCPRYLGRVISGIDISKPSPAWLQEKLRRSGLRSIDAVVDVTNYVLLELGQPTHAFDLDRLDDHIDVRLANKGEQLVLLDGKEISLDTDTMVIADKTKALAIAGVMGGEYSGVNSDTKNLFIECAYFAPAALAGKARQYGLHTDASHRYERGVDPELTVLAIERITQLLTDIVGGEPGPVVATEKADYLPQQTSIVLRHQRTELLSGLQFEQQEIEEILTRLGCEIEAAEQGVWQVAPPSWRFDMALEVDLIEELTRVKGYAEIPEASLTADLQIKPNPENRRGEGEILAALRARGYREAITYSFIDKSLCESCGFDLGLVELQNPIASDMSVMRPSLLPGLLGVLKRNQDRQEQRLRLYETGLKFNRAGDGSILQEPMLAGLACGTVNAEQWQSKPQKVSFYDVKQDIDILLGNLESSDIRWAANSEHGCMHPGRTAKLLIDGQTLGHLGEIHPALLKKLDIAGPVVMFELQLDALKSRKVPVFEPVERFPSVRRDIAVVLDQSVSAAEITDIITKHGGDLLRTSRIFDTYTGQGIDSNKKSIALSLTFRDSSRTLEEQEVNELVSLIVAQLEAELGAKLRQ